jgi:hypothetical protein
MRLTRTSIIISLGVLLVAAALLPAHPGQAQDSGAVCPALLAEAVASVNTACPDLAEGEVCLGAGEGDPLAAPGERASLSDLTQLATGALDPAANSLGIALFRSRFDLPVDSEAAVTGVLFGDAVLTNRVDPGAEPAPTITLQNIAGYPINLRSGAGTGFAVSGSLDDRLTIVADGRNAAGDWYRVLAETGPAWVFRDLITIAEGDPASLVIREDTDVLLDYGAPFQNMELLALTQEGACGAGSAGLLLHLAGEDTVHLGIDGVDLAFSEAALFVQGDENALQIVVLAGEASAVYNGHRVAAAAGQRIVAKHAAESGPVVYQAYGYAALEGAPLDLLPLSLTCTAGVLPTDGALDLLSGPGEDYQTITAADPELHYAVTGQAADDSDALWWRLDMVGFGQAWAPQTSLHTRGLCGGIEEVSAPPMVSAPAGGGQSSGLVPAGQSVWQTDPGLDNPSGTCTQPPVAMCAHLAAIVPNANGTLSWRGQEPVPYTMQPAGADTYAYNGRNALNNGNLQMTLTFTSPASWTMVATTIYDNDPGCQHTFYYTASRNW